MNIRFLIPLALLAISGQWASAAEARARLLYKDGSHDDVLITAYVNGSITYRLSERDMNRTRVGPSRVDAFYFYEPRMFAEGMDLFRGRKYAEAKKKFAECEEAFKPVDTAPNNYASLGGFYKMECSRRLMKLDDLSSELEKFRKKGLTRETQLQQLEVNAFWEAVRLKDWERLDRLAQAWRKRKVTGSQRAQIAYCHGLALDNLAKKDPKRTTDALNAYNRVLSADFTASTELVISAAHNALGIYSRDPKVALAIKLWKTEDENENSSGHQRLLEANTLVKLYKQAGFHKIKPLTPQHEKFSRFAPSKVETTPPAAVPKPEAKAPEKKAPAKKAPAKKAPAKKPAKKAPAKKPAKKNK